MKEEKDVHALRDFAWDKGEGYAGLKTANDQRGVKIEPGRSTKHLAFCFIHTWCTSCDRKGFSQDFGG